MISTRFLAFGLVGSAGVIVHLATLHALLSRGLPFVAAQTAAMFTAMAFNHLLNNAFTYRDLRRRGWRFLTGFGMFASLCSIGVVAGVGVSSLVYTSSSRWWVAGLAAAVVGAAWNYVQLRNNLAGTIVRHQPPCLVTQPRFSTQDRPFLSSTAALS